MNKKTIKTIVAISVAVFLGGLMTASASHSWGNYHWGRTANPFALELGSNVSSAWSGHLNLSASDWSLSNVLDTVVAAGKSNPRNCKATDGRVEVCSSRYGNTGWLGIAQIWVSGGHIVKGAVKVNDTYFDSDPYNTPEWRNLVMCQEIGHTLGLNHQDEDFYNEPLGTCMDYSADPAPNQHPNLHDYEMLESIYAHLDSVNTVGSSDEGGGNGGGKGKPNVWENFDLNDPSAWGQAIKKDAQGKDSLYARDLGKGKKLFTFVIWTR